MTPPAPLHQAAAPLKILFVTPEVRPVVQTGGLADVSAALPAALRRLGVDVRILLPGYRAAVGERKKMRLCARIGDIPEHGEVRLLSAGLPHSDVPLLLVDYPIYYDREGGPYLDAEGHEWPDNAWRFGLFSHVAARLGSAGSPLAWRPDIVHCNDWQSALAPALMHFMPGRTAATLMTVHNLAYQGVFAPQFATRLGLPASSFHMQGVEYYGRFSFLKAGLYYADHLSTVSPTYAEEIQSEPLGFGLQGLLAARKQALTGILNGVDAERWNPASDPFLPAPFGPGHWDGKQANKTALQQTLGLEVRPDRPILGVVSRLTPQKGLDLLLAAAPRLLETPVQIAMVGNGDRDLERDWLALQARHPGAVAAHIGFDERLSHLVEAGADIFVMPSRFEPCGLNQMYSQLYGTPPVVHATGGLADTVVDATASAVQAGEATGFVFREMTARALEHALLRALDAYRDEHTWRRLQLNGMSRDFSWDHSARGYLALYRSILAARPHPPARIECSAVLP
ncbi:MAG: glycogen synthase GlgA [Betaproteobacteria bacterium]|nr:glycogen synthase GlgA [Betaproteobacteria bacterium]